MLTLSRHNMEIKTTIGNRGFLMYKIVQMFIQTYLKFYQEYFKMVCASGIASIRNILKWFACHIYGREKLPIGPFSQIHSHFALALHLFYLAMDISLGALPMSGGIWARA